MAKTSMLIFLVGSLFCASSAIAQSEVRLRVIQDTALLNLSDIALSTSPWEVVSLTADPKNGAIKGKIRFNPTLRRYQLVTTGGPLDSGRGNVTRQLKGKSGLPSFRYRVSSFPRLSSFPNDALSQEDPFAVGGIALIAGRITHPLTARPEFVYRVPAGDELSLQSAYQIISAKKYVFNSPEKTSSRQYLHNSVQSRNPYVVLASLQALRPAQTGVTEFSVSVPVIVPDNKRMHRDHTPSSEAYEQIPAKNNQATSDQTENKRLTATIKRFHGIYLSAMFVDYLRGMTASSQLQDETALASFISAASEDQKRSIFDALQLVIKYPRLVQGVKTVHFDMLLRQVKSSLKN